MWSKIRNHPLAKEAKAYIIRESSAAGLSYHNFEHVMQMYDYLERTGEPYNEALDWAVLYHDIVYDAMPEKEVRSANRWIRDAVYHNLDEDMIKEAARMIKSTEKHLVERKEDSAIIRADLHALTDCMSTVNNFFKIMNECKSLYSIDEKTFASSTIEFMNGLISRVEQNYYKLDRDHQDFYKLVQGGILSNIEIAEIVRGKYYEDI